MKKIIIIFILITGLYSIAEAQLVQSNFQGVLVPQYIASGTSTRLPYIFRATVTGLQPNLKYRYYTNACRYTDFGGTNSGAGNPLFINGSDFRYTTSTGLSTVNGYDSILTDAAGSYTGWFGFVHTGNARFTAGNFVYPSITLDSGGNGVTKYRFALNDSISVLQFSDSGTSTSGTGIYGISNANPKNVISLYDNITGTGRPLAVVFAENEGIDTSVMASLVKYYKDSVDSRNGRWGTVIPNILTNGVRRFNIHRLTNGSVANFQTDADGVWPSGVNTVNPRGGSVNPLRISLSDAPLIIKTENNIPDKFTLEQNYPNPFNPSTTINFSIPVNGNIELKLFDILGKETGSLLNGYYTSGTYSVNFSGSELKSGVYFYTMNFTGDNGALFSDRKKLMLVK
ncbi:MAG: T9SS type A sorting domain-containing protein [Ignavibacteria bacterium]|nr:T9SS type A sorting domain-containing protein [Ignavibacteria bacterium]